MVFMCHSDMLKVVKATSERRMDRPDKILPTLRRSVCVFLRDLPCCIFCDSHNLLYTFNAVSVSFYRTFGICKTTGHNRTRERNPCGFTRLARRSTLSRRSSLHANVATLEESSRRRAPNEIHPKQRDGRIPPPSSPWSGGHIVKNFKVILSGQDCTERERTV